MRFAVKVGISNFLPFEQPDPTLETRRSFTPRLHLTESDLRPRLDTLPSHLESLNNVTLVDAYFGKAEAISASCSDDGQ
jgi:hypothetical protein